MTGARLVVACALVLSGACGGGTAAPSPTPNPPAPPTTSQLPATPGDVRVVAVDNAARSATIAWNPADRAERYAVEYGPLLDSKVRTTVSTDGPQTTVTLRDLSLEPLSLRVRGLNAAGAGERSAPGTVFQVVDASAVVEALFFATGPYGSGHFAAPQREDYFLVGPRDQAHTQPVMLGWRAGVVPVRVESDVPDNYFRNLLAAFAQIQDVTGGETRPQVVERSGRLPDLLEPGEVRVYIRDDLGPPCGNPAAQGCAPQYMGPGGEIAGAQVYVALRNFANIVTHETGHAVLGLHHIVGVQWPEVPVMEATAPFAPDGFSHLEIEAIQRVYRSGLRFGATRADFKARGLIN